MKRSQKVIEDARQAVGNELRIASILAGSQLPDMIRQDAMARVGRLTAMEVVLQGPQASFSKDLLNNLEELEGVRDTRDWLKGKSGTEVSSYLENFRGRRK